MMFLPCTRLTIQEIRLLRSGTMRSTSNPNLVISAAAFSCLVVTLLQSLVVPAIPLLPGVLGVSPTTVSWVVTADITRTCPVPTIGIGAGAGTDAQVLVWHDMADLPAGGRRPKFVHQFGAAGTELAQAAATYKQAVHQRTFPAKEHSS